MTPEYHLYHGAVLLELVSRAADGVSVRLLPSPSPGRAACYVVDECVGIHVKHSAARLRPWQFSFTRDCVSEIHDVSRRLASMFVALVCRTDGVACLSLNELQVLGFAPGADRFGLRLDRRRGHHYSITGPAGNLPTKKSSGLEPVLAALATTRSM